MKSLKDLNPNPRNPRRITDEKLLMLKKSLKEFGDLSGIVFNKTTGHVVGGHQRLKALPPDSIITINEKGYGHVNIDGNLFTYREVEWDEIKEKAANIAANKHGGEFDLSGLSEWLLDLDAANFDMDLTGFNKEELENLLVPVNVLEPGCDEDETPEVPKESKVVLGDLFILGDHRLLCADSTDILAVERLMNGEKADMVLTDPPYGMFLDTDFSGIKGSMGSMGRKNGTTGNKYEKVIGDNEDFSPELINTIFACFESCKEMFLFGADYYAEHIIDKNNGSWLVWDKRKDSQADAIGAEFELCWSKQKHKRRMLRHDWFGFLSSKNTLDARNRVHPTQKPVTLFEDIITQWGKDAHNIIDLFGGSGSTLIACEKTNRKCFMMELDCNYISVILDRWEKYSNKKAVREDGKTWEDIKNG